MRHEFIVQYDMCRHAKYHAVSTTVPCGHHGMCPDWRRGGEAAREVDLAVGGSGGQVRFDKAVSEVGAVVVGDVAVGNGFCPESRGGAWT